MTSLQTPSWKCCFKMHISDDMNGGYVSSPQVAAPSFPDIFLLFLINLPRFHALHSCCNLYKSSAQSVCSCFVAASICDIKPSVDNGIYSSFTIVIMLFPFLKQWWQLPDAFIYLFFTWEPTNANPIFVYTFQTLIPHHYVLIEQW